MNICDKIESIRRVKKFDIYVSRAKNLLAIQGAENLSEAELGRCLDGVVAKEFYMSLIKYLRDNSDFSLNE